MRARFNQNLMNKYSSIQIISFLIIVLFICSGLYYLFFISGIDGISRFNNPQSGEMTLRTILGFGKDLQCTFTRQDGGTTKGIVYTSGNDMRGDFTTTSNEKSIDTHMIKTSTNIFIWSDTLTNQGIKLNVSNEINKQPSKDGVVNLDEEINYSCTGWNKDVNKFVIPSSINFIDAEEILKGSSTRNR